MNLIKVFKNYGVLAHEKEPVYTAGHEHLGAVVSDEMYVEIPKSFEISRNYMGELLLTPPGSNNNYTVDQLLQRHGEAAAFKWVDDSFSKRYAVLKTNANPTSNDNILEIIE